MNHRTPAEDFRARLAALSRPQLEEAMRYLRSCDEAAMDRALGFAALPVTIEDSGAQLDSPAPIGLATLSVRYCMATRDFGDGFTALCDRLDKHARHNSPGRHEGDPDITWTDEPRVYAGGFGATIAEGGQ